MRSLGVGGAFNSLYVTVDGEGNNSEFIGSVAADVKDKVENSGREVYRMDEHLSTEHPMIDIVLAMLGVLGALGALVAVLSGSLIINTLNALLTDQLRQIGVMKLVGGRSYQILGMYLILIVAYGLISLVLAAPLGAVAGYAFAWGIASLLGAVIGGFRIIPAAVVTQVLMAILLPLGAGFFPVNSGARTSVQQAISNYRPRTQTAQSSLLQLNAKRFKWIPRPILLSFRNTFRQRGRLLLTIFTLTMAGAVFIAVFNVRDSMDHLVGQLSQHFMSDVMVDLLRPYPVSKIEQTLLGIPGVRSVEGWGGVSAEIWMRTTMWSAT
jgi:putative ABC transport system permease protein